MRRTLRTLVCLFLSAAPATAQIELDGTEDPAERARNELYDSLSETPRSTPVARVAQAVGPSVVYVETEMVQAVTNWFGGTQRRVTAGAGSGVVIHPSGYIVTNYHVVEGARQLRVSFDGDPQPYPARLMSYVREEDLALLKIEPSSSGSAPGGAADDAGLQTAVGRTFPTVRMGTSSDLMLGEQVVAIGSPHGQTYTVSTGIISGLHRDVAVPSRQLYFRGLIQTDASINRGNSGGPLLNIHGELIGINTIMDTQAENIGFAIPVDRVRQVLTDSLFPNARRVWLGFDVDERAGDLVVTKVWPDSPASEGGICEGDRVAEVGGAAVADGEEFLLQTLQVDPGDVVTIGVDRGEEVEDVAVQSWDEMNGAFFEDIGLTVIEKQLGRGRYLMVDRVRSESPASALGVEPRDIIPAVRPKTFPPTGPIRLSDKATLRLLLDRIPRGTEIEIDAYRDLNGDSNYQRSELLKGVLVR
ncbi:MAG: trypsin-like peptidase domain-containing protein [Planctomycetota bacterium]